MPKSNDRGNVRKAISQTRGGKAGTPPMSTKSGRSSSAAPHGSMVKR